MNPITPIVHLIDDDAAFLKATSRLLKASGFAVQTFSSATDYLAQANTEARGCVVADLHMPELNGLELQDALSRVGSTLPVVFLTGAGDIPSTVRAMRAGAEDFLTKLAPKEELLDAVRRALARDADERNARERLGALRRHFAALTPRESEVLAQVLQGRLNKQIAGALGIDERSVKRHRTSFMSKLQVQSVAQLTRLAHEARWSFSPNRP